MRGRGSAVFAALTLLAAAMGAVLPAACSAPTGIIHMATTTTVDNSGLLAVLLPEFQRDAGLKVDAVVGGSGRALDILDRGDADVALTHDPEAERKYLDKGVFGDYRKVMFNDFVIAGPAADLARVREAVTAVDAMTRIASSTSAFASRGDSSGTHTRELTLWKAVGRRPEGQRVIETGQGMAATLRIASERQCYVLTDTATFAQLQPTLQLVILNQGDPILLNTYSVTWRKGLTGDRLEHARRFADWLTDGRGRDVVSAFQVRGAVAFTIWPAGLPRSTPEDLPRAR